MNRRTRLDSLAGHLKECMALILGPSLLICLWAVPSFADPECTDCHANFEQIHGTVNHTATPGSGIVVIHADTDHDDAGWYGPKPYFGVQVDCVTCHNTYLPVVHGNDCATCHPTPYNSLEKNWNGGCQQGGCHVAYHENSTVAHLPWEDAYDPDNDCDLCHNPGINDVVQANCLHCHASSGSGNATPPVTTSTAQSSYNGAAKIDFSITIGGKVGIGRTFYRLDGGPATGVSQLLITAAGSHELEFWSVDQSGNVESPTNRAYFTVAADDLPPVTSSDAKGEYWQGAQILLTATDSSTYGVKSTYYRLNSGTIKTGSVVQIPATSGVLSYTLDFWSVDWSGNTESQHRVNFTVTSGYATIRLIWGNSEADPGDRPTGDDWADWYVWRGAYSGYLAGQGQGRSPGWDGVDDVVVPVRPEKYFIRIDWQWQGEYDETWVPDIDVRVPGQLIRINY